jgi:hypothetical protein
MERENEKVRRSKEPGILEDWDLEISAGYHHTCGEKMISLVKTDSTGYIILAEIPVFCPDCDSIPTAVHLVRTHLLSILGLSEQDYQKIRHIEKKTEGFYGIDWEW